VILAIETSCDETAVAVLGTDGSLLSSLIASQIALHQLYGGVVPEAASREHLRSLPNLMASALAKAAVALPAVDAFAATAGPGLSSSLMVGAGFAKGLALGAGKPYIGINHLEGHLLSPFFGKANDPIPRHLGLIVSGGHTLLMEVTGFRQYRRVGGTRDDAAGEAFDKVAKLLGLPYPGGPQIDRLAQSGDPARFELPRGMLRSGDGEMSFSGLKTAVRYLLPRIGYSPGMAVAEEERQHQLLADVCASFQEAAVDVLTAKTLEAARRSGAPMVAVSGGVSLNTGLRARFARACAAEGIALMLSPPALCMDNAAMIASVAHRAHAAGCASSLTEDIHPSLALGA
jgi:N6-L-threonylcarbamoyladenine synthase